MCACEPGYTCSRCRDTPHDPRYHDDPEPLLKVENARLKAELGEARRWLRAWQINFPTYVNECEPLVRNDEDATP